MPQTLTRDQYEEVLRRMAERGADADTIRKAAMEMKDELIPEKGAEPTYLSRLGESYDQTVGGLKTLYKAVTGQLPPEQGKAVAQAMMAGPAEAVAHPFKTAVRMVGINPDTAGEDIKRGLVTGNFDPLLGDVTIPGMAAFAGPITKAAGAAVPAVARAVPGAVRATTRVTGRGLEALDAGTLPRALTLPGIIGGAVAYHGDPVTAAMTAGGILVGQKAAGVIGRGLQKIAAEPSALEATPQVGTSTFSPQAVRLAPAGGFSPPVPGSGGPAPVPKPVDPVKLWSQEARNLNKTQDFEAAQEAARADFLAAEKARATAPPPVDPAKAWMQEAKNLNIAEKVKAQRIAAEKLQRETAGLEPKTTYTASESAPGISKRTTYGETKGGGYLPQESMFSDEEVADMLKQAQPRAGVLETTTPRSAMTEEAAPLPEPPPEPSGINEGLQPPPDLPESWGAFAEEPPAPAGKYPAWVKSANDAEVHDAGKLLGLEDAEIEARGLKAREGRQRLKIENYYRKKMQDQLLKGPEEM